MHKPGSVQKYENHKILRDFDIRTDHPVLDRINELAIDEFSSSGWSHIENENEWKDIENQDLVREMKRLKIRVIEISIVVGALGTVPKG